MSESDAPRSAVAPPDDAALWEAGRAARRLHHALLGTIVGPPACEACAKPWPCAGYVGGVRSMEIAVHPSHADRFRANERASESRALTEERTAATCSAASGT